MQPYLEEGKHHLEEGKHLDDVLLDADKYHRFHKFCKLHFVLDPKDCAEDVFGTLLHKAMRRSGMLMDDVTLLLPDGQPVVCVEPEPEELAQNMRDKLADVVSEVVGVLCKGK